MSTLLKGAWGIVLSHMANSTGVVFEYLVHGRDDSIAEAQYVIGCCVHNVRCRLQIEDHLTAEDLLSFAGQQMLASIPHANIGSTTVARECADWGFYGHIYYYSSWVLHQNIDVIKHVGVGEAGYVDVPEPVFGGSVIGDFAVITTPYGSQAVKILLLTHYVVDFDFARQNPASAFIEWLGEIDHRPASVIMPVQRLAGPEWLYEIETWAVVPGKGRFKHHSM